MTETAAAMVRDDAALARAVARCLQAPAGVVLSRLGSGRANDTYLARTAGREAVVSVLIRGRPSDARRRHSMLATISDRCPLAPRPIGFCEDLDECGAAFVAMERRHGVVPSALDVEPSLLRRLCESFVDALASLHRLEVVSEHAAPDYRRRNIL